jgi:hypothetical protein
MSISDFETSSQSSKELHFAYLLYMFFSIDYSCDRQSHSILVFKLFDDAAEQGKRDSLPYFATCVWWICPGAEVC